MFYELDNLIYPNISGFKVIKARNPSNQSQECNQRIIHSLLLDKILDMAKLKEFANE